MNKAGDVTQKGHINLHLLPRIEQDLSLVAARQTGRYIFITEKTTNDDQMTIKRRESSGWFIVAAYHYLVACWHGEDAHWGGDAERFLLAEVRADSERTLTDANKVIVYDQINQDAAIWNKSIGQIKELAKVIFKKINEKHPCRRALNDLFTSHNKIDSSVQQWLKVQTHLQEMASEGLAPAAHIGVMSKLLQLFRVPDSYEMEYIKTCKSKVVTALTEVCSLQAKVLEESLVQAKGHGALYRNHYKMIQNARLIYQELHSDESLDTANLKIAFEGWSEKMKSVRDKICSPVVSFYDKREQESISQRTMLSEQNNTLSEKLQKDQEVIKEIKQELEAKIVMLKEQAKQLNVTYKFGNPSDSEELVKAHKHFLVQLEILQKRLDNAQQNQKKNSEILEGQIEPLRSSIAQEDAKIRSEITHWILALKGAYEKKFEILGDRIRAEQTRPQALVAVELFVGKDTYASLAQLQNKAKEQRDALAVDLTKLNIEELVALFNSSFVNLKKGITAGQLDVCHQEIVTVMKQHSKLEQGIAAEWKKLDGYASRRRTKVQQLQTLQSSLQQSEEQVTSIQVEMAKYRKSTDTLKQVQQLAVDTTKQNEQLVQVSSEVKSTEERIESNKQKLQRADAVLSKIADRRQRLAKARTPEQLDTVIAALSNEIAA